jgi:hypothetical protein
VNRLCSRNVEMRRLFRRNRGCLERQIGNSQLLY